MSKGSWIRPRDRKKYDDNYDRIFGNKDKHKLSVTDDMISIPKEVIEQDLLTINPVITSTVPVQYRLTRKQGELVLQGCFEGQDGIRRFIEWRDIPTVHLE